jgi:hypothetical protein
VKLVQDSVPSSNIPDHIFELSTQQEHNSNDVIWDIVSLYTLSCIQRLRGLSSLYCRFEFELYT